MRPDEIDKAVQAMKAAGAPDEAIHAFLRENLGEPTEDAAPSAPHRPLNKEQIARLDQGQREKNAAELSPGERLYSKLPDAPIRKFLGAAALPLQGVVGGEALQALASSRLGSGGDYRTALKTQRKVTDTIGAGGQLALKAVGGGASMAIPGMKQLAMSVPGQMALGAAYGGADANADMSGLERGARAIGGAVAAPLVGWGIGKAAGTNTAAKAFGGFAEMAKGSPNAMRVLGALTPTAASTTGRRLATQAPSADLEKSLSGMVQWGKMSNAERAAVRRLAAAEARSAEANLATPEAFPDRPGMPKTMGADVASPYVIEEARGAARSTPGREALTAPFAAREAQAVPSITEGVDDAMAQRYAMASARRAAAKQEMEDAIRETTGVAVDMTPELEAALRTPAGKTATKSAVRSRLNVPDRPLPEVPVKPAAQVEGYESTEFIPPGQEKTETGLDAEALHLVTRAFRRMAQAEQGQQKPAGKAASDAIAAGDLRSEVLSALPASIRQSMDNYRIASEEIAALDLGRTKHPLNPVGLGKSEKSLTDVERIVGGMGEGPRAAYQVGKQHDLSSRLLGGQSVESMAADVAIPGGQGQREAALSGAPFQSRLAAWNKALENQRRLSGGEGPSRVRTGEALSMDVVAPTKEWAAVRGLREMFGKMSDKARAGQGLEDAAFNKMLVQPADAYKQALANAKTPAARERILQAMAALAEAQRKY